MKLILYLLIPLCGISFSPGCGGGCGGGCGSGLDTLYKRKAVTDTTNPTDPADVTPISDITQSLTSYTPTWTDGTDSNLDYHQIKACLNNDCETGCLPVVSPATGGVTQVTSLADYSQYYICVQAVDTSGNVSNWVASPGRVIIDPNAPPAMGTVTKPGDGFYKESDELNFTIAISKPVTVTVGAPNPAIMIDIGGTTKYAYYVDADGAGGNTGTSLRFRYTIEPSTNDNDGIDVNNTLILNGGTIVDANSSGLSSLTFTIGSTSNIIVDTTNPTAPSGVTPAADIDQSQTYYTPTWTDGTDSNLDYHQIKACLNNDCETGCLPVVSPATGGVTAVTNLVNNNEYYICAQGIDKAGNVSNWTASSGRVIIDPTVIQGVLDKTFADNGEFLLTSPAGSDSIEGAVTAPDGSIFLTGYRSNGSDDEVILMKISSNGTLDTSFNGTGYITRNSIAGGSPLDRGHSIDLAPDGDLLIGGRSNGPSYIQGFLWKVSTTGVDDTSFGNNGTYILDFSLGQTFSSQYDNATGKIFIVAAYSGTSAWRVLADGSGLDTNFDSDGTINISSTSIQPCMNIDNSGNLLVAAAVTGGNGRDAVSWILDTSGSIITAYGNPLVHADLAGGNSEDSWKAIIPYGDNKLILAGFSVGNGTSEDEIIARVNRSDGSLDTSFGGGDGFWTEDVLGISLEGRVTSAVVREDGSIIAVLEVMTGSGYWDVGVIRLDSNGTRDMSFASGSGILMLGTEWDERGPAIVQQPDGRILVLAYKSINATEKDIAVWAIR